MPHIFLQDASTSWLGLKQPDKQVFSIYMLFHLKTTIVFRRLDNMKYMRLMLMRNFVNYIQDDPICYAILKHAFKSLERGDKAINIYGEFYGIFIPEKYLKVNLISVMNYDIQKKSSWARLLYIYIIGDWNSSRCMGSRKR